MRRRFVAVATIAALAMTSGPAWATSRVPAYFNFAHQSTGANSAPSVAVLPNGTAVVAWIDFSSDGNGLVETCRIALAAAKCSARPTNLGEASSAAVPIRGGSGGTPVVLAGAHGEVVILAGGQNTYAYVSHDSGATFAAPVAISESLNLSGGELVDGGSAVLIAGSGHDSDAGAFHFVEVPLDGSGLMTPAIAEPLEAARSYTFGFAGAQPVVAAQVSPAGKPFAVAWFKALPGGAPGQAAGWSGGIVAGAHTPSLATTSKGLVLGAVVQGRTGETPASWLFTGSAFSHRTILQNLKINGVLTQNVAAAGNGLAPHPRYTITWDVVGGEGAKFAYYSASSSNGVRWVLTKVAPLFGVNAVLQSSTAAIAPDGAGLVVQNFEPNYRAVRLYVGTVLTVTPAKAGSTAGKAVRYTARLRTDTGVALPGKVVHLKLRGVTLTAKTNAKGAASFVVGSKATATATLTYAGDPTYAPSHTTAKYIA